MFTKVTLEPLSYDGQCILSFDYLCKRAFILQNGTISLARMTG